METFLTLANLWGWQNFSENLLWVENEKKTAIWSFWCPIWQLTLFSSRWMGRKGWKHCSSDLIFFSMFTARVQSYKHFFWSNIKLSIFYFWTSSFKKWRSVATLCWNSTNESSLKSHVTLFGLSDPFIFSVAMPIFLQERVLVLTTLWPRGNKHMDVAGFELRSSNSQSIAYTIKTVKSLALLHALTPCLLDQLFKGAI